MHIWTDFFFFLINIMYSYDEVRNQMDRGFPRLISWDFPRVGSRVDAVFENYGEDVLVFRYRYFEKKKIVALLKPFHISFLQGICISHLDRGRASTAFLGGE